MATFTLNATAQAVSVGAGKVLFPPAVKRLGAKASSPPVGSADSNGLLSLMAETLAVSSFSFLAFSGCLVWYDATHRSCLSGVCTCVLLVDSGAEKFLVDAGSTAF